LNGALLADKKGSKGQAAIALAKQQAAQVGNNDEAKRKAKEKQEREAKKASEAAKKEALAELFVPVQIEQKVRSSCILGDSDSPAPVSVGSPY
jgi:hypothetical protein